MVTVSLEMTETDMVVALHVTLKMICASILKNFSPIQLNMYFSKFSSQKLNPLRLECFIDLRIFSFQQIDLNKKEIYLLGDFNINLFQNGKFLLKEN